MPRSSRLALALAVLLVAGCKRAGDDGKPLVMDSSTGGVIDRDPSKVATTVGHLLTDENVFAVLDTTYGAIIVADRMAQSSATDARIRDFAGKAVSQNSLARSGIKTTADRLNIAPALPDRSVIEGRIEDVTDLREKRGAEFDEAYLEHVIDSRKDLIDEIDDALKGTSIRQNAVREFLREVRTNLESDRQTAESLKEAAKR